MRGFGNTQQGDEQRTEAKTTEQGQTKVFPCCICTVQCNLPFLEGPCLQNSQKVAICNLEEVIRSPYRSDIRLTSPKEWYSGLKNLLLDTMGSPALGQGSNCKLGMLLEQIGCNEVENSAYKVYFKCSSISIIAAWLPHL
jgi:hypothetical protein